MTGYGAEVDACHEIEHYEGPEVKVFDYCDRHFRILELDLLKFAWKLTRVDQRPFLLDRLDYAIEKVEGAYFWLPVRCEICNDPDYILNDLDAHGLFPWCVCEETPQRMLSKYISEEFKPLIQSIFAPFEEAQLKKVTKKKIKLKSLTQNPDQLEEATSDSVRDCYQGFSSTSQNSTTNCLSSIGSLLHPTQFFN